MHGHHPAITLALKVLADAVLAHGFDDLLQLPSSLAGALERFNSASDATAFDE